MEKVTIRLETDDLNVLRRFYPRSGYNAAIRQLVHAHAKHLLEQESELIQSHRPTHSMKLVIDGESESD